MLLIKNSRTGARLGGTGRQSIIGRTEEKERSKREEGEEDSMDQPKLGIRVKVRHEVRKGKSPVAKKVG